MLALAFLAVACSPGATVTQARIRPTRNQALLGCLLAARQAGGVTAAAVKSCEEEVPKIGSMGFDSLAIDSMLTGRTAFSAPTLVSSCGGGDPKRSETGGEVGGYGVVVNGDTKSVTVVTPGKITIYQPDMTLTIEVGPITSVDGGTKAGTDGGTKAGTDGGTKGGTDGGAKGGTDGGVKGGKDGGVKTPGSVSTCALVLAEALNVLAQCENRQWTGAGCEKLQARMRGCPDPTHIMVDPDQGYVCRATVDAEAVKDAAVRACESRTTPGPTGGSPCTPPNVDDKGFFHDSGDICSNPKANVSPDGETCIVPLVVRAPPGAGQPDITALIIWARKTLGGPIFTPKPPTPPRGPSDPPRPRN
jgi:hypothetical protein